MRIVIQRVKSSVLHIDGKIFCSIGSGILVLVGIEESDTVSDIEWICKKIIGLRIFDDDSGVMNLDVKETNKEVMVVSQFTLHASTKKGNRPSYIKAAGPDKAKPTYDSMVSILQNMLGKRVVTGQFGAHMEIALVNDGPVTIIIDSKIKE